MSEGKHFWCYEDRCWYVVKDGKLMATNGPPPASEQPDAKA